MTVRQVGPGSIMITTSLAEIDALADERVLGSLLGKARWWQLQDDAMSLVQARTGPGEVWTSTLQRAVSRRLNEPRVIYCNRHVDGWLVSDRIGSTLVPFEPAGPAKQHDELTIATMDFSGRPHIGHVAAETLWEAVDAAVKFNRPDTPLVLRTDAADVVVNAALALVWVACAYTMGENAIRISFSKSAEWLYRSTWNDAKKLAPPVKFECANGSSWLAPLRALPTEADPVLDLRGAP